MGIRGDRVRRHAIHKLHRHVGMFYYIVRKKEHNSWMYPFIGGPDPEVLCHT